MDFHKPGANKRVCAYFIDCLIIAAGGRIISYVIAKDISFLFWLPTTLLKDCFNGQSIGKYLVGTCIVDEKNLPVKYSKTIIRNIFMEIPLFFIVEYFMMLKDKKEGKRIGDKVAKTKVTDLKPQVNDSIFLWISVILMIFGVVLPILLFLKGNPGLSS